MKNGRVRKINSVLCWLGLSAMLLAACGESRVGPAQAGLTYSFLEVPVEYLNEQTEKYLNAVFDDRFTFEDADPLAGVVRRTGQDIARTAGAPVLARPIAQNSKVIQIRIPTDQEARIREEVVAGRKTAVRARIRFAGIAPGGLPLFDLLGIVK